MTVTWTREQRKIAAESGLSLICIALDGKHADPAGGRIEFTSPADAKVAKVVADFLRQLVELTREEPSNA